MVYKLFLRRLGGKIAKNQDIERGLRKFIVSAALEKNKGMTALLAELSEVNQGLIEEFDNIEHHYKSFSLFLETLLRKSHFDEGRLTLRKASCNMKEAVVRSQLERFVERLSKNGVEIEDQFADFSGQDTTAVVDVGLMAQVYGNLFSNALKYTREVDTEAGKKKYISFGRKRVEDFFGPGKGGFKYNVFSTGPHIPEQERDKVFGEGYRGSNVSSVPGTGHGLAFVKNAVEIHGGVAGYEAVEDGNNFYFVLPE
jgi:signal transduction histidine kinase